MFTHVIKVQLRWRWTYRNAPRLAINNMWQSWLYICSTMNVTLAILDIFFVIQDWVFDFVVLILFAEWENTSPHLTTTKKHIFRTGHWKWALAAGAIITLPGLAIMIGSVRKKTKSTIQFLDPIPHSLHFLSRIFFRHLKTLPLEVESGSIFGTLSLLYSILPQ